MNAAEWLLENNNAFRELIQQRVIEMLPGGKEPVNTAFKPEFKEVTYVAEHSASGNGR